MYNTQLKEVLFGILYMDIYRTAVGIYLTSNFKPFILLFFDEDTWPILIIRFLLWYYCYFDKIMILFW